MFYCLIRTIYYEYYFYILKPQGLKEVSRMSWNEPAIIGLKVVRQYSQTGIVHYQGRRSRGGRGGARRPNNFGDFDFIKIKKVKNKQALFSGLKVTKLFVLIVAYFSHIWRDYLRVSPTNQTLRIITFFNWHAVSTFERQCLYCYRCEQDKNKRMKRNNYKLH